MPKSRDKYRHPDYGTARISPPLIRQAEDLLETTETYMSTDDYRMPRDGYDHYYRPPPYNPVKEAWHNCCSMFAIFHPLYLMGEPLNPEDPRDKGDPNHRRTPQKAKYRSQREYEEAMDDYRARMIRETSGTFFVFFLFLATAAMFAVFYIRHQGAPCKYHLEDLFIVLCLVFFHFGLFTFARMALYMISDQEKNAAYWMNLCNSILLWFLFCIYLGFMLLYSFLLWADDDDCKTKSAQLYDEVKITLILLWACTFICTLVAVVFGIKSCVDKYVDTRDSRDRYRAGKPQRRRPNKFRHVDLNSTDISVTDLEDGSSAA